jgi:esterase
VLNHKIVSGPNGNVPFKPWLVLIHGLFGSLDNLNSVARDLADTCSCLLIDLPNHGKSETVEHFDFDLVCVQIEQLLSSLNIDKTYFLGHSLGGKIALHMGLKFPNLCASIVAADIAPVKYAHRHQAVFDGLSNVDLAALENRQQALAQLSAYIREPSTQQFLLKGLYKDKQQWRWRFRVDQLIANYSAIKDWHDSESVYYGRTLFIIGGNSDYVMPEHKSSIKKQFPYATAKVIQGAGHWLHAEKPTVFNKIVKQHIQAV